MEFIKEKETEIIKHYDVILGQVERKILSLTKQLNINSFSYEGKHRYKTTYYDTPENLLTKAGILMYKTWEKGSYYIKIDRLSIVSSHLLNKKEVFQHPIEERDTPIMHSFYLINGISNLFSTPFSIDIEHVIKTVEPKIYIDIESTVYKAFSGTGFKCNLAFEECHYVNLTTKRKRDNNELVVRFEAPRKFLEEFNQFTFSLEKHCKELLPKNERRFNYAKRITKPIEKVDKKKLKAEKSKKEKKSKKAENVIQG